MYDRGRESGSGTISKQQEEASEDTQGNALFNKKRKNADVRATPDELSFNIRVHNKDEQKPRASSIEGEKPQPEELKNTVQQKNKKKTEGKQHKGKRRRERVQN